MAGTYDAMLGSVIGSPSVPPYGLVQAVKSRPAGKISIIANCMRSL